MDVANRRSFLAATALGSGLALHPMAGLSSTPAREADPMGLTKADLPTPALLVDLEALEANLKALADHCRGRGCAFRPHAKTHKCPEIARLQVAAGARGVSVATVPEAEAMVAAGIRGVLLTSPIVDPAKVARMVALAKSGGEVLVAVGNPRTAGLLAEAASAAEVTVDVLLDLDVGDHRFGILPGPPARELAREIARSRSLRLRGLQAYSGLSSHVAGFEARQEVSRTAMALAVQTIERLTQDGHDMAIFSGGSTGTYNIDSELPGIELQAGSYVFMDVEYRAIGGRAQPSVYADFRPSLTVLTTVVSASLPDRVTVDAGVKSFATDSTALPESKSREGLRYKFFGDEFGLLTTAEGAALPRLGDRLEFYVPHCDPTVNLYDRIYALRGERVEAIWPVVARKEAGGPESMTARAT